MVSVSSTAGFLRFVQDDRDAPKAASGGKPPRRRSGPVMMGDIHGTLGGRPTLLVQWDAWKRDAAASGPDDDQP